MDFDQFSQSIGSPALRAVMLHWNAARGGKKMPAWEDLDPKAMVPQLPLVWAYRFERETGEFIGRLAGEKIAQAYGKSFRGLTLAEIHTSPERYGQARALLTRVIQEPAIFRGRGRVYQLQGEFQTGERIILPLAGDGASGDGVFGATETGTVPVMNQPVQGYYDAGDWFSLKD